MNHAKLLLIVSSLFGLWGVLMGAHMAGGGSYALSAIHAHVLVLGWLTLFAWSLFHKIYQPKQKKTRRFSGVDRYCRCDFTYIRDVALQYESV